mmetsp:Transcript_95468/g.253651  ORF Transcript_95468/g.253651 Transcript_95468/m.253651 type:complete len:148 (-) Transcript_95468:86-529(-)
MARSALAALCILFHLLLAGAAEGDAVCAEPENPTAAASASMIQKQGSAPEQAVEDNSVPDQALLEAMEEDAKAASEAGDDSLKDCTDKMPRRGVCQAWASKGFCDDNNRFKQWVRPRCLATCAEHLGMNCRSLMPAAPAAHSWHSKR